MSRYFLFQRTVRCHRKYHEPAHMLSVHAGHLCTDQAASERVNMISALMYVICTEYVISARMQNCMEEVYGYRIDCIQGRERCGAYVLC